MAEPDEAVTWTVTVAAPDRTGLFATIAGVLALHRLSVRSAQVRTEARAWRSTCGPWCPTATTSRAARRCATTSPAPSTATSTSPRGWPRGTPAAGCRPVPPAAPRVDLVEAASATATVVEVRAGDRPGLLYRLGRALALMGVNIRGARVVTLGAEAVDVFYLQDSAGAAAVRRRRPRGGAAAHRRGGLSVVAASRR